MSTFLFSYRQWVLSAYALTFGGLLLLGGRAADLLGRRRLFMAGVLFLTATSLMRGLAWSPAALLAARVVQGVGAAVMTPTALSIIAGISMAPALLLLGRPRQAPRDRLEAIPVPIQND